MLNTDISEYLKILQFLGQTLGIGYEIALHQVEKEGDTLISIVNNHVSSREVDYPYSTPSIKSLMNVFKEGEDGTINVRKKLDNGKEFISSTFYIKDAEGNIAGKLCLNFDFWAYNDAMLNLMHLSSQAMPDSIKRPLADGTPDHTAHLSNISHSLKITSKNILETYLKDNKLNFENLSQDDKIIIVNLMSKKDVFAFKGGISIAANALACSESTIYRYLNKKK